MSGFTLPTSRPITQAWAAEFDDWDGDGVVDYPGGFYHSIGWDGHNGIDYGCYVGDPVEAVADGIVTFAGNAGNWHPILSGGGNAILVEHPAYGVQTEYLHLSAWLVNAGDTVTRGQIIAHAGKTGAATAPHLHLGMLKINGYNLGDRWRGRIDPTPYLYGSLNPDYTDAGIAAMGSTTPVQEDAMAFTPEQEQFILASLGSLVDNVATKADVASRGQIDFTEAALRSLVENVATKADLSGVSAAVANAVGAKASRADIEAAVRAGMSAGLKVDVTVK